MTFTGPDYSPNVTAPSYPTSVNFTNGSGTANGITLYDAENATLNAAIGGATGSTTFTVNPGAVTGILVSTPDTQAAGTAFDVTINVEDSYGNTSTNLNGSQPVSFSGPSSSPGGTAPTYPTSVNFTNGAATASVTLYDAESTALVVTTAGGQVSTPNFTVTSGALQSIAVTNERRPAKRRLGVQPDCDRHRRLRQPVRSRVPLRVGRPDRLDRRFRLTE